MMLEKTIVSVISLAFLGSGAVLAAQNTAATKGTPQAAAPAANSSDSRADAYYYFTMGHLDEQQYDQSSDNDSSAADAAIDAYKKALAAQPDSSVIRERLAEIEAKSQRIRDAVLDAREAIKDDPNNAEARRLLAGIYIRTLGDISAGEVQKDNLNKAVEQFQEILKIKPDDASSALWLARLYHFEHQDAEAESALQTFLQHDADNPAALEQLSQIYLDDSKASQAISLLTRAADESSSPDVYELLGHAYFEVEDFPKAEQAYRKAMEGDPDEPIHLEGLAKSLFAEQKYADALSAYNKLVAVEPDGYENYLRMGEIDRLLGKYSDAETALEHAKQLAPGNPEILDSEAQLYEAQGRYDDAAKVLTDTISRMQQKGSEGAGGDDTGGESQPTGALAILYEQLGRVYDEQGNVEDAIGAMKKALDATPNDERLTMELAALYGDKADPADATKLLSGLLHGTDADQRIYLAMAQVQERGKAFAEAQRSAEKAEQMSHETSQKEMAWLMLGDIYERQKKYEEAEQQFRKALGADPNDSTALNDFGYMLAERGVRLAEATQMIQQAVQQEPGNGAFLDSLGWVYYKQNKLAEAEDYLKKAVDREGHDPTILGHLGDVYLKLGDDELAEAVMERARTE